MKRVYLIRIICGIIFLYAIFQIAEILEDYKQASKEYELLAENVLTITEYIPEAETLPGYELDFASVKAQNKDFVGWIILPDSKINYPIVKSMDNEEYLTTTFEGEKASSGAIFMDRNCENDFSSKNTIIYGHNMKNGSMFRALNFMSNEEYFASHHTFCIDQGNGFEDYEVISCYETVETDTRSWKLVFESEEAYRNWLLQIKERCTYECQEFDAEKNTITLSTCRGESGGVGRFIVHLQKKDLD